MGELEAEKLDSRRGCRGRRGAGPLDEEGHDAVAITGRKGETPVKDVPGGGRALHGEGRAGVEFASRAPRQPQVEIGYCRSPGDEARLGDVVDPERARPDVIGLAGVRPDDLEVGAVADRKQCVRRAQPIVAAARGGGDPPFIANPGDRIGEVWGGIDEVIEFRLKGGGSMHGTSLGSCVDIDRHDAGSFVDRFASVDAQRLAVGGDEPASCRTDPPGDAVGKAGCECCAEGGEVDVVRAEAGFNIGPSGELPGPVTYGAQRPTVGGLVVGVRIGHEAHSFGEFDGKIGGTASQHIAFVQDSGDHAREPGVTGVDDHPGETRVYRQLRHTTAEIGGSTGVVERTEGRQKFDRFRPACRVGWGEEGQGCRGDDCSSSKVKGDRCHVVLGDGGWGVGCPGCVFGLRPESDRNAGSQTAGAPGPLVSRRPTAVDRMQATHPGSGVESSRSFEPAVDDGGNAVDREGGFGDVRRKNDSALGPGDEGGVLLSRRQAAVKGEHGRSVGAEGGGQFPLDRADLTDPGQEDEHVTRPAKRLTNCSHHGRCEWLSALLGPPDELDRVGAAGAGHDGRIVEMCGDGVGIDGCRHQEEAGVVLARLRAGEHQREADISRHRPFVELVEDHESDVGEGGIVDQASGQDALGDDHQTGCRPDRPIVARDPPDGFACVFAEESGQPASRRSGCHSARLEQHDRAAVEPRLMEQAKRQDRRLARTRLGGHDTSPPLGERSAHVVDTVLDRQIGERNPFGHPVHLAACRCGRVRSVKVHLVDGTYELFRFHYAKSNRDPRHGAQRGVLNTVLDLVADGATHLGIATDHVIESWRNDLYEGYKDGAGIELELFAQFPEVEELLTLAGFEVWPQIEHEADDAMAAAAAQAAADERVEQVVICTPDKDLAQCVTADGRVIQFDRRREIVYDRDGVIAKFGVPPESIPDYLGVVGDTADGFPGLPGWGAKSAAAILTRYGHIDHVPHDVGEWDVNVRGAAKLAQTLHEQLDDALLFRRIATVDLDAPVSSVDAMAWRGPQPGFDERCEALGADRHRARAYKLWENHG